MPVAGKKSCRARKESAKVHIAAARASSEERPRGTIPQSAGSVWSALYNGSISCHCARRGGAGAGETGAVLTEVQREGDHGAAPGTELGLSGTLRESKELQTGASVQRAREIGSVYSPITPAERSSTCTFVFPPASVEKTRVQRRGASLPPALRVGDRRRTVRRRRAGPCQDLARAAHRTRRRPSLEFTCQSPVRRLVSGPTETHPDRRGRFAESGHFRRAADVADAKRTGCRRRPRVPAPSDPCRRRCFGVASVSTDSRGTDGATHQTPFTQPPRGTVEEQ